MRIAATLSLVLASSACQPSSVEDVASNFFIECMEEQGVVVDDVEVTVAEGRHIERFDWTSSDPDAGPAGQECEEETLDRFNISRT